MPKRRTISRMQHMLRTMEQISCLSHCVIILRSMRPICDADCRIRIVIPLITDTPCSNCPRIIIHQQNAVVPHSRVSPLHTRAREQRDGEQEKCGGYTAPREGAKPLEERSSDARPLSKQAFRAPFIHGAPLFLALFSNHSNRFHTKAVRPNEGTLCLSVANCSTFTALLQ